MEIHQLRYFVAVAEEASFSQAAQREHVSQPSLSQQIQKLEEELNRQLFDRLPRSVVLTEAGKCLLPYARVILTAIADAGHAVTALEAEVAGRLAVGAIPSIALYILPQLIGRFQQAYPKVTFELFEDTTDEAGPTPRGRDARSGNRVGHGRKPEPRAPFARPGSAPLAGPGKASLRATEDGEMERSRAPEIPSSA